MRRSISAKTALGCILRAAQGTARNLETGSNSMDEQRNIGEKRFLTAKSSDTFRIALHLSATAKSRG